MTRWLQETGGTRGEEYAARFAALEATGTEMHGEAEALWRLLGGPGRVLDAGCGIGRLGAWLAGQGCQVLGVDSDPSMIEVARRQLPHLDWVLGDLLCAELAGPWDLAAMTGNVIVYVEAGTEAAVVERLAGVLAEGGLLVSGWRTDRLAPDTYDAWAQAAGLVPVSRWSTWDAQPWTDASDWCVAVHRRGGAP
jgi:SAM-dependent methyltransferase